MSSTHDACPDWVNPSERLLPELCPPHEPAISLADEAKALMGAYDWPGNVRELDRTIRRAALVCTDRMIRPEDLEFDPPGAWGHELARALDSASQDYEALHEALDRLYLPRVLAECKTISGCARKLGITRDRLRNKLRALGLWGEA